MLRLAFSAAPGLKRAFLEAGDLDFLAGRGVAALAGGSVLNRECAEANQANFLTFLERVADRGDHRVERRARMRLRFRSASATASTNSALFVIWPSDLVPFP